MKKLALTLAALLLLTACGGKPTPTVQPTTPPPAPTTTVTATGTAAPETVEPTPEPTATQPQPTPTPTEETTPDNLAPPLSLDDQYIQTLMAMSDEELEAESQRLLEDGYSNADDKLNYVQNRGWEMPGAKYAVDWERLRGCQWLELYTEHHMDLDGDGKEESIYVSTYTVFDTDKDGSDESWQKVYLTINGKSEQIISLKNSTYCHSPFAVVDINTSDGQKELVFEVDYVHGRDSKPHLHFFCYRNGAIQYMNTGCNQKRLGSAKGAANWINGFFVNSNLPGDSTLGLTERLGTAIDAHRYTINYKLTKDHMLYDDADLYDMVYYGEGDGGMDYTFAAPVIAYYDRDLNGKTTTINATSQCNFTRTDGKELLEVTLKSGKKFWLNINRLLTPDGRELSLETLFDATFGAGNT